MLTKAERERLHERIRALIASAPDLSSAAIARRLGTTTTTVCRARAALATQDSVVEPDEQPMRAELCSCAHPWRDGDRCARCGHDLGLARLVVC